MLKMKSYLLPAVIVCLSSSLFAQRTQPSERAKMHHEVMDEKAIPMPPGELKTSPAYTYSGSYIFTTQVNISPDGQNILNDAANEPSIAVDPSNPDRMVIGWRQFDNIASSFRQAGYAYTEDGGQTWTFPGSIDAGVFRSDPVLDVDVDGNFYYNSLTMTPNDEFYCTVYKTGSNNFDWNDGTLAQGGDKQWMVIDKTDGEGEGNNYSFWTQYWSWCYPGFFTRSSNDAASFEDCITIPGAPYWGTLAVGPEGELYIAGTSDMHDIMITKSTNAEIPGSNVAWDFSTPVEMDGIPSGWSAVNPGGLMGQVYVDTDVSDGPGRGNVYIVASLDRNSNNDPADVMFVRSTDGGLTWDAPVRINDDNHTNRYQWFATMSVAPNGRIDVVWLDTRVDPWNTVKSALFYSYSTDQGETWSVNEQLSDMFDPHLGWPQQEKMGDYYDMISDEGGAHLAWCNTLNGEQDVYYSYIQPDIVGTGEFSKAENQLRISAYPNPFHSSTTLQYSLTENGQVSITVYDIYGRKVAEPLNAFKNAGTHSFSFSADDLSEGVYIAQITSGDLVQVVRMLKSASQ